VSNIYNFDEIGIQIGGGRKGSGEQFNDHNDRLRYQISSEDLKLVTILESLCYNSTANIPPCFVFQGVNMCPEWFVHAHPEDPKWNGDILYTVSFILLASLNVFR
jgi:hypothetical protein